jgi:hypothetical protein
MARLQEARLMWNHREGGWNWMRVRALGDYLHF